ncbi:beta-ketoacyl synthase N-terminal-like domain-containing protein [Flavobacterium sp. NKUCC04_CG]|uniref:beta-ketoacyl synthase N-terminal-like domain-containing protein n=1 Tax=Flavobacterium sp. NKUCC04_CG TaxID=2842121 RepID=UPI001C5BED25|nr:beta-ketoacyl synthase N-terminal-like domain-containing protein [Flavobacterium sp. NKUCC04_CG]MBW3518403.1 beta-ketoacyl synthase chain length factor [Flavobacterium sp. NKUCC04_CG]
MEKVYINGLGSVSNQNPELGTEIASFVSIDQAVNYAVQPSYKELIAPAMLRRMAKVVKMGIYASQKALDDAQLTVPEAIITGTGMGCLEDSEKFLRSILENQEQYLTPTSFIQSTHNTVGAQIALRLQCKAYNFTYVHAAVSFESAMMDAFLQIQNGELPNALIGGIDEITDYTLSLLQLIELVNKDYEKPFKHGVNIGEGATFFCLQNQKTSNTYASVVDMAIRHHIEVTALKDSVHALLDDNGLRLEEIDALVLGTNGSSTCEEYYKQIEQLFPTAAVVQYKHLIGEYDTASAFGVLVASIMLKNQAIPTTVLHRKTDRVAFENVLVYNQLRGEDHSFILLKRC